jgi:hypothetical protein
MSRIPLFALILVAITMISAPLLAQEPVEETDPTPPVQETQTVEPDTMTFRLSRGTTGAEDELAYQEEEEIWEPGLKSGTVEVSFAFGFLDLNKTIWQHDQIIYRYTTDATSWGDVEITGKSAFNPALRLGYNLTDWISFEVIGGVTFAEYSSTIENRSSRENKPGAPVVSDPPLGEYDAEARSLTAINASLNAVFYPLSLIDDASGKVHPYLTAGVGKMWYDMNSNYFDHAADTNDFNFGGGIRLLADRNISVRLEIAFHMNEVQFDVAENFIVLNEGTTEVPVNEYPIQSDGSFVEQPVQEYSSQSLSLLNYSIGVQGSF